ncbi:MAG: TolC family protein [Planctomycetota bacterium]
MTNPIPITAVMVNRYTHMALIAAVLLTGGCLDQMRRDTDARIYDLVDERQQDAIGRTSRLEIKDPAAPLTAPDAAFDFTPRPITPAKPEGFQDPMTPETAAQELENAKAEIAAPDKRVTVESDGAMEESPAAGSEPSGMAESDDAQSGEVEEEDVQMLSKDPFTEEEKRDLQVFGLAESIAYSLANGRSLQNAKEDLYLAALDLSVERHLWTPRFSARVGADYANYGQVRDFDHAMSAVAEAAVSQRLPLGGSVTARVIGDFMRDLGNQVTTGESGTAILEADIPFLRGAGRVAYESRFIAERRLIYAVRTYERFRRSFVVGIADAYFRLQVQKAAIDNTYRTYLNFHQDWRKADFINQMGRSETIFDAARALSNLRSAEVQLVRGKEAFASALDNFKILIGMPVYQPINVLGQNEDATCVAVESLNPDIAEEAAIAVALQYRLDLLTSADFIDDALRGVNIAQNQLLPDLDFAGSVSMVTDPNRKNVLSYNTERTTWRAGLTLQMDDRVPERAEYRRSVVDVRRAERSYEQDRDTVRANVRTALRQIARSIEVREIQVLNVRENELRRDAAQAQFDLGQASNQDVIDAENELLEAQNSLADAIADYRTAILAFRLDTGTLLVTDDGRWDRFDGFSRAPDEEQGP